MVPMNSSASPILFPNVSVTRLVTRSVSSAAAFSVNVNAMTLRGSTSVVHHLRDLDWQGVWVCAYGPRELRAEWFPAPAVKTTFSGFGPWWGSRSRGSIHGRGR